MLESTEISNKLDELKIRRKGISEEKKNVSGELETLKQGVMRGDVELSTLSQKLIFLESCDKTISSIDNEIESLEGKLKEAAKTENKESIIRTILLMDKNVETRAKQLAKLIEDFEAAALIFEEKRRALASEISAAQNTFNLECEKLIPGLRGSNWKRVEGVAENIEIFVKELKERGAKLEVLRNSRVFGSGRFPMDETPGKAFRVQSQLRTERLKKK